VRLGAGCSLPGLGGGFRTSDLLDCNPNFHYNPIEIKDIREIKFTFKERKEKILSIKRKF
jgi:hypothetical protein